MTEGQLSQSIKAFRFNGDGSLSVGLLIERSTVRGIVVLPDVYHMRAMFQAWSNDLNSWQIFFSESTPQVTGAPNDA